jgi:23S rRNA pseudouridine1911/1915/1917 synthase
MTKTIKLSLSVGSENSGIRLDSAMAKLCPEYSRNHIKKWILGGSLLLNELKVKPKTILKEGDIIELNAKEEILSQDKPEKIPLSIIAEDEAILILDKPSGLVVHPGAGNRNGTLLNALLNYDKNLALLPRAGIVHRLDKDTSGIMVVAKTESSFLNLVKQLKNRTVQREYLALVVGSPISAGTIDEPIGRHPKLRTKQAVIHSGKFAVTEYKIVKRLDGYTLLNAYLKTGRTHQIRVHFAYKKMPIVGDGVYGNRKRLAPNTTDEQRKFIENFKRQALHAQSLSFRHPISGDLKKYKTGLPKDFTKLIECLEKK